MCRLMSASLKPLTVEEFLDWERAQTSRHEFDGIQPVAMTDGSVAHARVITRLTVALSVRVKPPCEAFGSELKVLTPGRVRYPDASVVCDTPDSEGDTVEPTVVFEVISPSSVLTDRRVKVMEYASMPRIVVYAILETERPEITVHRRATNWAFETFAGLDAELPIPEIGVSIPLCAIYAR